MISCFIEICVFFTCVLENINKKICKKKGEVEVFSINLKLLDIFLFIVYTLVMACSECKKKQTFKEEMVNSTKFVEKSVIWVIVIWSGFAIYGIYTLISKFI